MILIVCLIQCLCQIFILSKVCGKYHSSFLFLWIITCRRSRTVCSRSLAYSCWYCLFLFICSISCFYFYIYAIRSYFLLSKAEMYSFWTRGASFWYNYRLIYLKYDICSTLWCCFNKLLRLFLTFVDFLHWACLSLLICSD